jgi:hypothetical protein
MARQPYLALVKNPTGLSIDISTKAIGGRPDIEALIGNCLTAWPHVEAEMVLTLGQIVGAENAVALALFQQLRRSSLQRDAISDAGKIGLSPSDFKLLTAILNFHKSVETERNSLTHGHFGTCGNVPDGILWISASDYVAIRARMFLAGKSILDDGSRQQLLSCIYVYRATDLKVTLYEMKELGNIWYNFTRYLRINPENVARQNLYSQITERPRIVLELNKLKSAGL